MTLFKNIVVIIFASCVGMVAGTIIATPVIALMNYLASDGPYLPAPLIAWAFLALPIAFLLLPIQVLVVVYEGITRKVLRKKHLLLLAILAGVVAVIIWDVFLASSKIIFWMLIVDFIGAIFQALLVFGCHWTAYKLRWGIFK